MKRTSISILLLCVFLMTSCSPQVAVVPTATLPPTSTLTPIPTFTETPNPWEALPPLPEGVEGTIKVGEDGLVGLYDADGNVVMTLDEEGAWKYELRFDPEAGKFFEVCPLESFENCKFMLEDFTSGKVDVWLNTLKWPFDLEKMNRVPLEETLSGYIIPNHSTAPNFEVTGSETFHRDTTFGLLEYEEYGVVYRYIFIPVEFYDQKTGESHWVKTLRPFYNLPGRSIDDDKRMEFIMEAWGQMRVLPIGTSARFPGTKDFNDPLISKVFERYPDMDKRIARFVSGEDMSVLSEFDMLFIAGVFKSDSTWFK